MFNARTWHRLCISAYSIFPAILTGWFLPDDSLFLIPVAVVIGWGMLVALLGAIQGILFAFGRLRMGCPDCNAASPVTSGDEDGMWLDCPKCGELQIRIGRFGKLVAAPPEPVEEVQVESGSPLRAPMRHPVAFAIMFAPVVASIIAASVIHQFNLFYLIIPGFWCYGVGGFILEAIFSGRYGRHSRSGQPIRFWGNIAIWSMFYVFAAYFPIGFAKQERAKEADNEKQPAPAGIR